MDLDLIKQNPFWTGMVVLALGALGLHFVLVAPIDEEIATAESQLLADSTALAAYAAKPVEEFPAQARLQAAKQTLANLKDEHEAVLGFFDERDRILESYGDYQGATNDAGQPVLGPFRTHLKGKLQKLKEKYEPLFDVTLDDKSESLDNVEHLQKTYWCQYYFLRACEAAGVAGILTLDVQDTPLTRKFEVIPPKPKVPGPKPKPITIELKYFKVEAIVTIPFRKLPALVAHLMSSGPEDNNIPFYLRELTVTKHPFEVPTGNDWSDMEETEVIPHLVFEQLIAGKAELKEDQSEVFPEPLVRVKLVAEVLDFEKPAEPTQPGRPGRPAR